MDGMNERASRPSMADVAARAGVSGQTVSRVVNGMSNVGEATRLRVEAALAELDYRPHGAARALRTGRTQVLGVVVTTLESVGNSLMLGAIAHAADAHGQSIALVTVADARPATFVDALAQLSEQGVDGVIVVNEASRFAAALDADSVTLPLVLIDAPDEVAHPTVRSDHEAGAAQATRELFGDRAPIVHHVAGPEGSFAAMLRERGWRRALTERQREHGLAEVAPPVLRGDWTAASGHQVGGALAADPAVTAVFCANDQMALGVIRALHEAGRAVPDDVAVIGFDGIADGADFWPPLTTMAQDFDALANRAVTVSLSGDRTARHDVLPVSLITRQSSVRNAESR